MNIKIISIFKKISLIMNNCGEKNLVQVVCQYLFEVETLFIQYIVLYNNTVYSKGSINCKKLW